MKSKYITLTVLLSVVLYCYTDIPVLNNAINDFITECFSSNGNIKEIDYPKSPSKWNCTFCPYKDKKELCNAVGKSL